MSLRSLARPVENIDSIDEMRVLAIVDHLSPMLDDWREGQDLRAASSQTEQELAEKREALEAAQREIRGAASRTLRKRASP